MRHRSPLTHVLSKILVALLIATFVASALPPRAATPIVQNLSVAKVLPIGPAPAAAAESRPAEAVQATAPAPALGILRFAEAVDATNNATSNPTAGKLVPVIRIGAAGQPSQTVSKSAQADQAVLYAVVALAVQVTPDSATHNPAGVMVEFHLWNDAGQVDLTQRARADAWGAASAQFFLDDLHLAGQFHYQASAVSYGETPARSFTFDSDSFSSDVQLGAAHMTTQVEADGRLIVDVQSDPVIDDSLLGVQLTAVRLIPNSSGSPEKELLPPLLARRLDDHHARAEIYLDAGDYLLSAAVTSGEVEARSQPVFVRIESVVAPPIAVVEQLGEPSEDGQSILVQYRTPDGDVALMVYTSSFTTHSTSNGRSRRSAMA